MMRRVVLGSGQRLFAAVDSPAALALTGSQPFGTGIVVPASRTL